MTDFDFKINEHFDTFKIAQPNPEGWPGSNPRSWFDWVAKMSNTTLKPSCLSDSVSREAIFAMVADKSVDTASCCTAILAWGGMNRKHGKLLYSPGVVGENSPGDWLSLACDVRNGQHERKDAYDQFIRLRASKTPSGDTRLPGMGPAYFTKLIFFLMPENMKRGYIMDQWTAASTNLLSGGTMIHLQRSYPKRKSGSRYVQESVSDKNDSNVYEKYCQFVEFLADQFKPQRDPCVIEEMMFSKGGKNKDSWRGHVVRARQEASADTLGKLVITQNGEAMDQRVERLKSPEECKIFARNAEDLGRADLASEARQRSVQLLAEAHGPAGEVERACLEAIFAYEEVLSERNSKKTRAARTWQMIKRHGIVAAVELAVCRDVETSGYQALKDLGLSEYSFEAVVLKYPNIFSHEALSISKERILVNS